MTSLFFFIFFIFQGTSLELRNIVKENRDAHSYYITLEASDGLFYKAEVGCIGYLPEVQYEVNLIRLAKRTTQWRTTFLAEILLNERKSRFVLFGALLEWCCCSSSKKYFDLNHYSYSNVQYYVRPLNTKCLLLY